MPPFTCWTIFSTPSFEGIESAVDDNNTITATSMQLLKARTSLLQKVKQINLDNSSPMAFPVKIKEALTDCDVIHDVPAFDVQKGQRRNINNVLITRKRAYWIKNTIQEALFGRVCLALELRRCSFDAEDGQEQCEWQITDERYAVKIMEFAKIMNRSKNEQEDPMKEVMAMHYLSESQYPSSGHVINPVEMARTDEHVFVVMPFYKHGDLFDLVRKEGPLAEDEARVWMKQIIKGVQELHANHICHRDLSLENILVDGNQCCINDLGMCLLLPSNNKYNKKLYINKENIGDKKRLLIKPQGACGKYCYVSPEIFKNKNAFDPYASDIWSLGIILFMMLSGSPAYEKPVFEDEMFRWIVIGKIDKLFSHWKMDISEDALELLQGMLRYEPHKRLTLEEVMSSTWMKR